MRRCLYLLCPLSLVSSASAQCDPATLFAPPVPTLLAGGSTPINILAADLNADGNQDLVIAESGADTVALLFGNGDGTLLPPVRLGLEVGVGDGPAGLAIADVTGDAVLDLIVTNGFDSNLAVLIGAGDGTFTAGGLFDTGFFTQPTDVAASDLDNDGDTDLVVSVESNQIRVLTNDGTGSFGPPEFTIILGSVTSVAVGHLNADDIPDFAVTEFASSRITVGFGTGNTTFAGLTDYPAPLGAADIQIVDMDGDGDQDLVAASFFGDTSVWLNDGNGVFAGPTNYATSGVPRAIKAADVDGDGDQDLLVATGTTNPQSISFFPANGDGTLGVEQTLPAGNNCFELVIADFNNDDAPDVAAVFIASNDYYVYLNTCAPPCPADLAPPQGVLNFFDISAYITAFNAQDPVADFAAPFGVFNFFDIAAYIAAFNAGCP